MRYLVQQNDFAFSSLWTIFDVKALSSASMVLMAYGALMWIACGLTCFFSVNDARTLRDVGIWVKPMKFMASTAVFAWTTVWLAQLANPGITHGQAYQGICGLLVITSLFEVAYITYQASQGAGSHYNTTDVWHAFMFGLMAIAAVGLTASQGWLAWEVWRAKGSDPLSVTSMGVIAGLVLTFILATVSGFMLGGNQPPAGSGLPIVGWHFHKDIRPAHFLGVHAQQFIPFWGLIAERFFGTHSTTALAAGCCLYAMVWSFLVWTSLGN
jgi:hypothetical protein